MSTSHFRATLDPLLADPAIIAQMESLSLRGRPAVEAIGAQLAAVVPDLGDTDKQRVGRLVRDTLAKRGWTPKRKARVAPGKLFAWGAVYRRVETSPDARNGGGSGAERLAAVRRILAEAGVTLPTVDEFLAERKRMWDV